MPITKVTESVLLPTYHKVVSYLGETIRAWLTSPIGIGNNNTNGSSTDYPNLRIQRDADHTGGTTDGSVNASALSVALNVNKNAGRVDNYENAIVGQCNSYRSETTGAQPNITAFQGGTFKYANSLGGFFGSNFVARDETGNASSVSLGSLIAQEIDVVASGPDDNNSRIVQEVIARAYTSHASDASVYCGIRVRPSEGSVAGGGSVPIHIKNAVLVREGGLGSVGNGYVLEGCQEYGLLLGSYDPSAGFVHAAFRGLTGSGSVEIGSNRNNVSGQVGTLNMTGTNSLSTRVTYANIFTTISVNTASAESGTLNLAARAAGVSTIGLQVRGNTGTNPVYLNISGTLQQVTAGANDSAGSGFRQLRVPN